MYNLDNLIILKKKALNLLTIYIITLTTYK